MKPGLNPEVGPGVVFRGALMRALVLCFAATVLGGCASSPPPESLEARQIDLERQLDGLRRQAATIPELRARIETLEATLEAPSPAEPLNDRLLLLEAEVARLRQAPASSPDEPTPPDGGPAVIRTPDPVAPPPSAEHVQPLSLASGSLLMLQTKRGLVRLKLRGIEVPQPARTYAEQPVLLRRHQLAFGEAISRDDTAFKASQDHLASLLAEVRLHLDYADQPPPVDEVVEAYLIAERGGGDSFDVGAAMIRAGYAIAREGHPRADRYRGLETGSRGAKLGLFADGE